MSEPSSARVIAALDASGVAYELLECDPDLADTEVFCRHYGYPPEQSANTLIVASKSGEKQYVACVVLAHTRLDVNKTVRKRMGVRRLSFAGAEETRDLTGMVLGGVTAPGLPADLPLWVDARVMQCDYVILGGGSRSLKIKISPAFFETLDNVTVVEGLAGPIPPAV